MIRYLYHKQIDKSRWNGCIERAANRLIYACSWYLDIVSPEWDALVENDYEVVMPLAWRKKMGIKYIFQPLYTQQLGIFSASPVPEELTKQFLGKVPADFRIIDLNLNFGQDIGSLDIKGYTTRRNTNFILELKNSYQEKYDHFSDSNKKNIRRAERNNFTFSQDIRFHDFSAFMEHTLAGRIGEVSTNDFRLIEPLLNTLKNHTEIKTYGMYSTANELLAAACFVFYGNRINFYSSSSDSGKKNKAMFYLLNSFIRDHSGQNMILDFSGSNISSIAYFFKGFGSADQPYYSVSKSALPWYLKTTKAIIDKIRKLN